MRTDNRNPPIAVQHNRPGHSRAVSRGRGGLSGPTCSHSPHQTVHGRRRKPGYRLSYLRATMDRMKTSTADGTIPGAHYDQPFRDCARCYGATYGAALTGVIQDRQASGGALDPAALHRQTVDDIASRAVPVVLCPAHSHLSGPRWSATHIEYARATEALHGRRVVGVILNRDGTIAAGAFDCATSAMHAARGRRVIVVSDCQCDRGHQPIEALQRICDSRYRIAVPR